MSFRVYGMTESEALRMAWRLTSPKEGEAVSEWAGRVKERAEKILASKRQAPISPVYDAPQFCREFIDLARRAGRCRGLHIRRPVKILVTRRGKAVEKTVWQECEQHVV